jgi:hypothetical protein
MSSKKEDAVQRPQTTKREDWAEKIERAKEARAAGKELRKEKPATFSSRVSP